MDGMTEDVWDDGSDDRARGGRAGGGRGPDGRDEAFRPVAGWGVLWRSAFVLWHGGHEYVVDVDFLDWDERIRLYRDRRLVDEQRSRARFDLGGAALEARMSLYGMRYVRVVDAVGDVRDVPPMPGTAGDLWFVTGITALVGSVAALPLLLLYWLLAGIPGPEFKLW